MRTFEEIIQDLGTLFGEELHSHENRICTLEIDEIVKVQLEIHPMGDMIQLSSMISELPPGSFRQEILKNGLKANFLLDLNQSVLAYTSKPNQLVLYQNIPFDGLTADKLYDSLLPFVNRVKAWKAAIDSGRPFPSTGEIPEAQDKLRPPMLGF